MTLKRSYSAGHFELQIDGHATNAYLKSVEGGHVKATMVEEPVGPHNERVKHSTTVDIEPLSLDLGISSADHIIKWIQASWRKKYNRRNGQITHADFDLYRTYEHGFSNALITEATFPALDGSAKDGTYLKVKIQPEDVSTSTPTGRSRISGTMGMKQKMWTPSAFRFNIDGIDEMRFVNKIESFTIKQGIKKHYAGQHRFAEIEPTKIEFPNLSGTIGFEHVGSLMKWHKDTVMGGQCESHHHKTGSIEYLSPDRKQTIFAINLFGVGLLNLAPMTATANSDQIKRMKFDMFVHHMEIDGKGLGME
ncbi:MAG: phage tail protein [Deltaproteobacteria bacterium]|nr:phage tail protein [Deltaproteobacteria bacterium]